MKTRIMNLKPSQFKTDLRVQRALDPSRVKKMSADFKPGAIGVLVVSLRTDGTYVVLDGQHRAHTLIAQGLGDVPVPCDVRTGLSLKEEAELFEELQKHVSVRAVDRFRVRLTAEEPEACDIRSMLKKHGLKVTQAAQTNGVIAVQALVEVYRRGNLEKTLEVLHSWNAESAFDGPLIRGMSSFLIEYPDVEVPEVVKKIRKHPPQTVSAKIGHARKAFGYTMHQSSCMIFREFYNERRRDNRLAAPVMGEKAPAQQPEKTA